MYKNVDEFIRYELNPKETQKIYNNIENAVLAVNDLIRKNDFFRSDFILNISGRLINYAVIKSFEKNMLPKPFIYTTTTRKMEFGQKRIELSKENIKLDIAKTNKSGMLPTPSKYKKLNALNNWGLGNQLYFDNNCSFEIKESPNYGIITYGVKNYILQYVEILIPDYTYNYVLKRIDIQPKITLTNVEEIEEETQFFDVEKIKNDIIKNRDIIKKFV